MPNDPAQLQRTMVLLDAWEARSAQDQTLYAEFDRVDMLVERTKPRRFRGEARLSRPDKAFLQFKEVVDGPLDADGNPPTVFYEQIVADGEAVYHVLAPSQHVYVYPLAKDQKSRLLEEGPLPFMFNMKAQEAIRRFQIYLYKEMPADEKYPARYQILIRPREEIDRGEFIEARVLLDKTTFHPIVLQLVGPNGKDTKTFTFREVSRNDPNGPAANPQSYNGRAWAALFEKKYHFKVVVNPGEGAAPPANAAAAPPVARPGATPVRRR